MEPLVIFGAGLVMYCGYLAVMDEINDVRGWCAKRAQTRKSKTQAARSARAATRPVSGKDRGYERTGGYACSGALPAPQAR